MTTFSQLAARPRLYRVEIGNKTTDAEEFRAWLTAQGHDARVGSSAASYVDGERTMMAEADDVMNWLWTMFLDAVA